MSKKDQLKQYKEKLNKAVTRMAREGKIRTYSDVTGYAKAHGELIKKYKKSL